MLRDGDWHPIQMREAYRPELLIENSFDWYLLNALGPFEMGHHETWIRPMAPLRNTEEDGSDEVFGAKGFRARRYSTYSWVSLKELLAYDLDYFRVESGFVSEQLAREFPDPPSRFPEAAFRHGVPSPRTKPAHTKMHGFFGTEVSWKDYARDYIGYFWEEHVPTLASLGAPEEVRAFVHLW